jgi:two-component system response regulator MprA
VCQARPTPHRTILIATHDSTLGAQLQPSLEHAGFAVRVAADGQQAVALGRQQRPDLLVLDRHLPVMDGLELCRLLRAELHVPRISIAAAPTTMDEPSAALDGGADDYLARPFAARELGACVRAIPDGRPGNGRATIGGTIVWRGRETCEFE